jgi:glycosyltransferase involved in cell wall biosynthesis
MAWLEREVPRALKVTVLIMTYNHQRFIRQAIDSVLMQELEYPFEVLISEDCSTDGTREIVQEYAARHPGRIRLLLSEQNLHSNVVVARGIQAAQGEYIALLDGDDYWLSPLKLQKQVAFLDEHPECTVCFHQALVHHDAGDRPDWYWTPKNHKPFSNLNDIWMGNFIATCSTVFRNRAMGELPEWYSSFPITDWPLHILNAEHGLIGYIDEVLGVYRYHSGGAYSGFSQAQKNDETYRLYHLFNTLFEYRHDRLIKAGMFEYFIDWADEYVSRGDFAKARSCFSRSLEGRPSSAIRGGKKLLKVWLKMHLPALRRYIS